MPDLFSAWEQAERAAWAVRPEVETTVPASGGSIVPLADLKRHVDQSLDDDDDLLQAYEQSAQAQVADWLGRPLLACTRRAWFDEVPGGSGLVVRLSEPATSVTSVTVYDEAGTAQAVGTSVYDVDLVSAPTRLLLRSGEAWPSARRSYRVLAVSYTTGWVAQAMPVGITHAIKFLVAHWYANSQPVQVTTMREIPIGLDALLRRHSMRVGVA